MTDFARLIPAFTARVPINPPVSVGALAAGATLTHASIIAGQEALTSEEGYPAAVGAAFVHGADYIKTDPGGGHSRLEVDSLLRDGATGGLIRFRYTGVLDMSGPAGKVLRGEPDAVTTGFGHVYTHVRFEAGHPDLKFLENKVFVGSGRFILEAGHPPIVEYKISEVSN